MADPGGAYGGLWGDILHLDGSGSTDPDGDPIDAWAWDLDNDGDFGADDTDGYPWDPGATEPTTEKPDFTIPPKGTAGWDHWTTRTIGLMVIANSVWSDPAYSEILVAPEPATALLVGGALLALVRRRRRRR